MIPKAKDYRYLYTATSYKWEVVYHLINVASFHTTPVEYMRALSSAAELVLSTHLLLTARREALPWMGKDVARTQLIEQALEGGVSGLPAPTVALL